MKKDIFAGLEQQDFPFSGTVCEQFSDEGLFLSPIQFSIEGAAALLDKVFKIFLMISCTFPAPFPGR